MRLERGLVGHWTMDSTHVDGTALRDRTPYSNHGTLNGGVTVGAEGVVGDALGFDGTDDYVEIPEIIPDGPFTIALWFDAPAGSWEGTLFDATNDPIYFHIHGSDAGLWWQFESENDSDMKIQAGLDLSDGEPHHVVATGQFGSTGPHELYLDGERIATDSTDVNQKGTLSNPRIGDTPDTYGLSSKGPFQGTIDDVRIYERVLSDVEIRGLAQMRASNRVQSGRLVQGLANHWSFDSTDVDNGTLRDRCPDNRHATLNGGVTTGQPGIVGEAFSFDGTDDYLQFEEFAMDRFGATLSMWLYPTTIGVDSTGMTIITQDADDYQDQITIRSNGTIHAETNTNNNHFDCSTITMVNDEWQHLAVVFDNELATYYYNGEAHAATNYGKDGNGNSVDRMVDDTRFGHIGIQAQYEPKYQGKIADVRHYTRPLGSDEIQRFYHRRV